MTREALSRSAQHTDLAVTHVVAGLGKADGGPSYTVPALSAALNAAGVSAYVRCVARAPIGGVATGHLINAVTQHSADKGVTTIMRGCSALRNALCQDAREGALLHVHGLWLLPNLYPAWIKMKAPSTRIVHSPRGMLASAALNISTWKKRPIWHLWQKSALQAADCLHATAMSEYHEIRALGFTNPVAVIPNGIDVPPPREHRAITAHGAGRKTILSLGRLHPKKALDVLVRAWAMVEQRYPDWQVRIVGPSEGGHDEELRRLVVALGLERLIIEGAVYGEDKLAVYRDADVFALPTRNENFGIVVAEALAAEVPVIATTGAPWPGLELERCGWWIDHGVEALARALIIAMETDPAELATMGRRGRAWMERDFIWQRVATDMSAVYAWLRNDGPRPSTVLLV
ncbi:MAG: glycosyltransferase [Hyphomicrobium sp.]|nr:glycosyltransferase [Hyphomicrobium sp.]